jgi:hypothetical protein
MEPGYEHCLAIDRISSPKVPLPVLCSGRYPPVEYPLSA